MKEYVQRLYFILELSWVYLLMLIFHYLNLPVLAKLSTELIACFFVAAGSMLSWKPRHLYLWDISGLFFSIVLLFYVDYYFLIAITISAWAALSMGLGLSFILSMAMAPSTFDNRGRTAAFLALGVSLVLTLSLILHYVALRTLHTYALTLLALKLLALTLLAEAAPLSIEYTRDYTVIRDKRPLATLFASWLAFLIIDYITAYSIEVFYGASLVSFQRIIGMSLGIVFFPMIGYLIDRHGRRPLVLVSYLIIGFEYALISAYEGALMFYSIFESFSWCTLTLFFVFIVWSDVAPPETRTKLYVLGFIPVFLGRFVRSLFEFFGITLERYELYPFASLFMFVIAVLIFFFTPETLPSSIIERRRMINYIKRARKIKERYG
ncbi:MAG: hypothetical protein DRJ69_02780 [Thermoprotei archaeon]|nr:MAG: hypothetical protein DRJ69_02780 [Thermoprotei archaeon]